MSIRTVSMEAFESERLGLGIILCGYLATVIVLMTAWGGHLTTFWHPGIHLEQTSVAANYPATGFFRPFSDVQQGIVHLPPVYSWLVFVGLTGSGWYGIGKVASLIMGLGTLVVLHQTVKRLGYAQEIRLLSVTMLASSPLFLMLSGSVMQETALLFFSVGAMHCFLFYWQSDSVPGLLLATFLVACAVLSKWQGVFMLIPMAAVLFYDGGFRGLFKIRNVVAAALPLILGFGWLRWIQLNSADPPTGQLFNRFFFNVGSSAREIALMIGVDIVAFWPISMVLLALVATLRRTFDPANKILLFSWLAAGLSFYALFFQGSIHHDHYIALALPPFAILAALGLDFAVSALASNVSLPEGSLFRSLERPRFAAICTAILILSAAMAGGLFVSHSVNIGDERERIAESKQISERLGEQGVESVALVDRSTAYLYFELGSGDLTPRYYKSSADLFDHSTGPDRLVVPLDRAGEFRESHILRSSGEFYATLEPRQT